MKTTLKIPKLIASDYDGTLIASFRQISERSKNALWLAHNNGCPLALVTGRSEGVLPPDIDELPFDYLITGNGARIKDNKNGHYLSITSMTKETALQVIETLKGRSINRISVSLDGIPHFHVRPFVRRHKTDQSINLRNISYLIFRVKHNHFSFNIARLVTKTQEPIEKINVYFSSMQECQAAYSKIRLLDVAVYTTHGTDLEITAKDVTKGWALAALCKYLSISPDDTLAFGDSGNDSSMIDVAGSFLAPENAIPEVKANASMVIPSVENDGVAMVLEELFGYTEVDTSIFSNSATPAKIKH